MNTTVVDHKKRYAEALRRAGAVAAVALISAEIRSMKYDEVRSFVAEHVPSEVLASRPAAWLRRVLPGTKKVQLAIEFGFGEPLDKHLVLEAARVLGREWVGEGIHQEFWARVIRALDPDAGYLTTMPLRPELAKEFWASIEWERELETRPVGEVVKLANAVARHAERGALKSVILPKGFAPVILHPNSRLVREALERRSIFQRLGALPDATPKQLEEVVTYFDSQLSPYYGTAWDFIPDLLEVWVELVASSPHAIRLRELEPPELTMLRSHQHYQGFFEAYEQMPDAVWNLSRRTTFELGYAYGQLVTYEDRDLAATWIPQDTAKEYLTLEGAKMLSARAAEKAVIDFYRQLGCRVEDVAIKQLESPDGGDWALCDLRVDGQAVDVKNARPQNSSVDGRLGYAEHLIKSFKVDANAEPVTIAGVRSPFLQLDYLWHPQKIERFRRPTPQPVKVLGECSEQDMADLVAEFTSSEGPLEGLSIDRRRRHYPNAAFLPPWVFDYPERLYERAAGNYRRAVRSFVGQGAPPWHVVEHLKVNPLPYYAQVGAELPGTWHDSLREWEASLYERIRTTKARRSLPYLFLTLLTDFLVALAEQRTDYRPMQYERLLFQHSEAKPERRIQLPLGIFDPLLSIKSMVSTLESLWNEKDREQLRGFTRFEFTAAGLLRGSRPGSSRRISLLAWCGNCGDDLAIGTHEVCSHETCGYLICPKCNHCKDACPRGEVRSTAPSQIATT